MNTAVTWADAGFSISVGIAPSGAAYRAIPQWVEDDGQVGRRIVAKGCDNVGALFWWYVAEALRWCRVSARPMRRDPLSAVAAATLALDTLARAAAELPPAAVAASPWPFSEESSDEVVEAVGQVLVDALDTASEWTCPARLADAVDDLRIAVGIHTWRVADAVDLRGAVRLAVEP